jgi:hypothetical protein
MQKFTNPLDNIHIASPCSADWNQMFGDGRKRFCGDCKLNVYNLSDMTRSEAESFLVASEGRTCVKFYRRQDGSVLTKDCPVGWQAIKRRVSKVATAVFSVIAGLFAGLFAFNLFFGRDTAVMGDISYNPLSGNSARSVPTPDRGATMGNISMPINRVEPAETEWEGKISNLNDVKGQLRREKPNGKP